MLDIFYSTFLFCRMFSEHLFAGISSIYVGKYLYLANPLLLDF